MRNSNEQNLNVYIIYDWKEYTRAGKCMIINGIQHNSLR